MLCSKKTILLAATALLGLSACASVGDNNQAPREYTEWLDNLKQEMRAKGISQATLDTVYATDFYHAKPKAVVQDRKQPEFVFVSTDYLNRVVNKIRVEKAQQKYRELKPLLRQVEAQYNVPAEYLVAFWGVETNFGQNFGGHNVMDALTEMSYDRRRSAFFKNELYNALKIVDDWHLDYTKMQSSWAGAMGHFQFMPSTFNAYAVDFNNDGTIDIWSSFDDAVGSAANYLTQIGWQKDEAWGEEVVLPWNFDYSLTGRNKPKTVAEWKKIGVVGVNKTIGLPDTQQVSIIIPEGRKGHAYFVGGNFDKIMQWNRSENYALAIGILADYIKNGKPWKAQESKLSQGLKTQDVVKVQTFINRLGIDGLAEDGQLGSKTREAVKRLQKLAHLPQDGYPDGLLSDKIERYTTETGFDIPVQPRKLHKPK
jgi:membrane-bound lytic murein transglycosylase B